MPLHLHIKTNISFVSRNIIQHQFDKFIGIFRINILELRYQLRIEVHLLHVHIIYPTSKNIFGYIFIRHVASFLKRGTTPNPYKQTITKPNKSSPIIKIQMEGGGVRLKFIFYIQIKSREYFCFKKRGLFSALPPQHPMLRV